MNFSLDLQTLRLIYKLIVSISTTMDKKMQQRINLIREIGEKIKKIPLDTKFSKEELDKTLQRLQKKDTTGIFGNYRNTDGSAQHQNPPRTASSGQQLFGLDSSRYRNFYQPRDRTALANISSNSKESHTVAQAIKNSPQNKEGKAPQVASITPNMFPNLNQQPNLKKQPSADGSLSGESQDNTEKKTEPKLIERQVETVEQETKTKPPILSQQKEAEQQPKEIKLFGNSTSEPKQQTGLLASSKSQGGLFAPKPQGGLFASKPQGGLFAPKPQGGLFAPKAQGGLFAPKPQGGLFAAKPQGGIFAPKPQGGLISNSSVKSSSDNPSISLFGKPQPIPLFGNNQPAQKAQPLVVVQKIETEKNQPSLFGTTKTIMPTFNIGSTALPAPTTNNPEQPQPLFSLSTAVASETSKQLKPTFGGLFGGNTNLNQPILKLQPVPEQPASKEQEKPKPKPLFSINTQPAQNKLGFLDSFASLKQKNQKKDSSRPNMFTIPINLQLKKPDKRMTQLPSASETEKPEKPASFTQQQVPSVQPVSLFENIPTKTANEPPAPIIENKNQESPRNQTKDNDKVEKPPTNSAIGPGGQKIQMKPFYPNDNNKKQNIFGEKSTQENKNVSAEPQPIKTNLFQTATNLFQKKPEPAGLFAGRPPSGNLFTKQSATIGLFGQPTSNLFAPNQSSSLFGGSLPASKPLFGGDNIFSNTTQPKEEDEDDEQGEQDGVIEAKDEADPSLSTGNFQYIQTQVFFKETASKFREGEDNTKETIQNVVVSIQKFQDSASKYIYVRMANKCIALYGQLVPGITEIRILNNNARNLAVKKILRVMENAEKPQLVGVKIQFKEESIGERFKQEVEQAIAKPA